MTQTERSANTKHCFMNDAWSVAGNPAAVERVRFTASLLATV